MANGKWQILKIIKATPVADFRFQIKDFRKGLAQIEKELILVCQDGMLLLELVQPEGKRIMTGKEFLNGYQKLLIPNS